MNTFFYSMTALLHVVYSYPKIVRRCYNETPEYACKAIGGVPSMITATNISKYTQALKSCNTSSAIVGGWNGEAGLFVLTATNTLTPYEPTLNTSCHVICDDNGTCGPVTNPPICRVNNNNMCYPIAKPVYNCSPAPVYTSGSTYVSPPVVPLPCPPAPCPIQQCPPKPICPCPPKSYPPVMPCPPRPCYPCPPKPCPPVVPCAPRPCPPIPYPGHHHGGIVPHRGPHPPVAPSSSLSSGLCESNLLPVILATALLRPESFPCLAPIVDALKSEDVNILCCNKLCDSKLVVDPCVVHKRQHQHP
ncbi:hypothetical protein CDIK_1902 [Cucumispora dikerogammari]|nr:hypothetical protein CDIK_1902 [Cucumispora dikerogammari]